MKNDFKTLDAQNDLASLIQVAPNEADQVIHEMVFQAPSEADKLIHELVFQAEQIANGNQALP